MSDKVILKVTSKEAPTDVTWIPTVGCITLKINNSDVNLSLELGQEAVMQLKQALAWENDDVSKYNNAV